MEIKVKEINNDAFEYLKSWYNMNPSENKVDLILNQMVFRFKFFKLLPNWFLKILPKFIYLKNWRVTTFKNCTLNNSYITEVDPEKITVKLIFNAGEIEDVK